MYFLARFKTWNFWSKIILFYPEYQKKKYFLTWLHQKKPKWEKVWYLAKNHRLSPLKNLAVLHFLKLFFLVSESFFFIQNIKKQYFLTWNFQKTQLRKISIFGQKPWIIPLGKCPFFRLFKTVVFWSKI